MKNVQQFKPVNCLNLRSCMSKYQIKEYPFRAYDSSWIISFWNVQHNLSLLYIYRAVENLKSPVHISVGKVSPQWARKTRRRGWRWLWYCYWLREVVMWPTKRRKGGEGFELSAVWTFQSRWWYLTFAYGTLYTSPAIPGGRIYQNL